MRNKNRYNFLGLLSDYKIEIPVIQRDFAQGRKKNDKIEQIRKDFVKSLIHALDKNQQLHLDFIYGKVRKDNNSEMILHSRASVEQLLKAVQIYSKRLDILIDYTLPSLEKSEIAADYFIPLDGQQRLTTLYLLHWYLAYRTGNDPKKLNRFSYKTRVSSTDFCEALVSNIKKLDKLPLSFSAHLADQHFVFGEWLSDPTVSGMLVMLEEIHTQLKDTSDGNLQSYYDRLFHPESSLISFDFLDLDKIGAEDELYVKMNSRGKQLTDFENFKSWLIGYTKDKGMILPENWDRRMDIEWMDILWKHRTSVKQVDNAYLNLFKRVGQYCFITSRRQTGKADIGNTTRDIVELLDKTDKYLTISFYEENTIFNESSLNVLFNFLSFVEKDGCDILDHMVEQYAGTFFTARISQILFSGIDPRNLFHKTFLYAIIQFVITHKKSVREYNEDDKLCFGQWARVAANLIYNSRIDDTPEYISAITSLYHLKDYCENIIDHLASEPQPEIQYFPAPQKKDEIRKAKLIKEDPEWCEDIFKYEKHFYFYGQIGFLLDLAKDDTGINRTTFQDYGEKASQLFCEENLNDAELRLQRAFLSKGNYLVEKGWRCYCFCLSGYGNARHRDENWRSVFNDQANGGQLILKNLLDSTDTLDEIITKEKASVLDWRKYFIEYPELISICLQSRIRIERGDPGDEWIWLLKESKLSHYHGELYSYLLYLWLLPELQHKNCKYEMQKTTYDLPYLEIIVDNEKIQVSYDGENKLFKIWLPDGDDLKHLVLGLDYKDEGEFLAKTSSVKTVYEDLKSIISCPKVHDN